MAALSTGKNLTFLFSASTRLDATREWDCGGPIRGHHTMELVSLTVFSLIFSGPFQLSLISDCSAFLPKKIVDKLCYLGDMLSQEGGCEHAILKRIQTGWLKFRELSGLLIGKGMSLKSKNNYLYNMHKTCNVVWQWDMANKDRWYKESAEEWNEDVEMDDRSEFKWKEK